MKKRTVFLLGGGLAFLLLAGALLGPSVVGTRPFQTLTSEEVQSAQLELFPPDVSIQLTREEIARLVPLLNELVVYRRDDSWREYNGQLCCFTLTLTDGSQTTVQAYNPFLIVNGTGRRTEYHACEALNYFANNLRS